MNMRAFLKKRTYSDSSFLLMITIILFVAMYAIGMIVFSDAGFAKPQMFMNLFISNAGLIVISCGLTIVMITGGIDISVGSVVGLVCMTTAYMIEIRGVNPYMTILIALGIGLAFGVAQGYLVAYLEIQPFIVTLAGLFFGRGMTAVISTEMVSIKNELFLSWAKGKILLPFGSYSKGGDYQPAFIYPTVIVAVAVVILVFILLKYTKLGRAFYAVGGNRQSALMMGLNVQRTRFSAHVLSGLLAGLGGFLFCLNTCAGFVAQARGLEMDAIATSVIGGTLLTGGVGNPIGTLFGVLIKGTISSIISTQGTLSSWWVRIALSALLCFFIVLQSVISSRKRK
jgi:simple sugar transport system permease protein